MPSWLVALLPFLKGAIGWSAASFLNETLVKPSRARRRLAHVLAEEVAHNLQMLVGQNEFFRVSPTEIPADFQLSDVVFKAVLGRLGELPDGLTGDLLLFYLRVDALNIRTRDLGATIELIHDIRQDPDRRGGLERLNAKQEYLRRGVLVYRESFPIAIDQGDAILRQLRVEETLFGRLGYAFRKKPMLDPAESRKAAEAKAAQLREDA